MRRSRSAATTAGSAAQEPVDVGRRRVAGQGHPHVAVGERAHRGQHVGRLEAARRARRAGGDGEAAPVQLGHQRLAVDVEAGERHHVGEPLAPGRRPPRRPRGPPSAGPEPVDQAALPRADLVPLGDDRLQRGGRGEHRRDVLEPGHPGVGPVVGGERRPPAGALAHQQHADAGRAAPLVRGGGGRGPAARQVRPARRGAASTNSGYVVPAAVAATSASGCSVPTSGFATWTATTPVGAPRQRGRERVDAARAPRGPRGTPSVVPPKWRHHQRPAASTAECSTALCTSRVLVRRGPAAGRARPGGPPRARGGEA